MNEDIKKIAIKVLAANKAEFDSCDSFGRPDRYKKANASRLQGKYIDACEKIGMTLNDRIEFLNKIKEGK